MVELERDGGIARIFLNRPQKVNALDTPMLATASASGASSPIARRAARRGAEKAYNI